MTVIPELFNWPSRLDQHLWPLITAHFVKFGGWFNYSRQLHFKYFDHEKILSKWAPWTLHFFLQKLLSTPLTACNMITTISSGCNRAHISWYNPLTFLIKNHRHRTCVEGVDFRYYTHLTYTFVETFTYLKYSSSLAFISTWYLAYIFSSTFTYLAYPAILTLTSMLYLQNTLVWPLLTLYDLRDKIMWLVIINFFPTWCRCCGYHLSLQFPEYSSAYRKLLSFPNSS